MAHTLFYAAILILAGIVVNGLVDYALAKINFPFRERWVLIIILLVVVPTETIITINFLFVAKMGLLNTVFGYEISKIGDTIEFIFIPTKMHFFDNKETEVCYV